MVDKANNKNSSKNNSNINKKNSNNIIVVDNSKNNSTNSLKSNDLKLDELVNEVSNDYKSFVRKLYSICEFIILNNQTTKFNDDDKCGICLFELTEAGITNDVHDNNEHHNKCENHLIKIISCTNHYFHLDCLEKLIDNKDFFQCPVCTKISGIRKGDMPNGTMKGNIIKQKCDSYSCPTIEIEYKFPDGISNGIKYTGTYRLCYLPLNEEGIEICGLLIEAFKRRLTFTIGTSLTTGVKNTVIWNGIHHKTNVSGGTLHYGYPDNTYFLRVSQELSSKGVLKDLLNKDDNLKKSVEEFLNIKLYD